MKKKIALALLTVALLLAGLAGGAYAIGPHEPVNGKKLVGFSPFGVTEGMNGAKVYSSCIFRFTNPDCLNDIIIERVSIIKADGTLIYEGPYQYVRPDGTRVAVGVLKPHRVGLIALRNWMPDDDDGWLPPEEATKEPVSAYTVEIEWSASKGTCPLMGWGILRSTEIVPVAAGEPGAKYPAGAQIPMVNMKQKS